MGGVAKSHSAQSAFVGRRKTRWTAAALLLLNGLMPGAWAQTAPGTNITTNSGEPSNRVQYFLSPSFFA